jgi:hypothetical protein
MRGGTHDTTRRETILRNGVLIQDNAVIIQDNAVIMQPTAGRAPDNPCDPGN